MPAGAVMEPLAQPSVPLAPRLPSCLNSADRFFILFSFFFFPEILANCFSVTKLPAIPLSVSSVARHLGILLPASSLLSRRLQLPSLPWELFSSHFLLGLAMCCEREGTYA